MELLSAILFLFLKSQKMLSHFEYTLFLCHLLLAIMCKYDIIHKISSTQHIAMLSGENQAMAIVGMYKKLLKTRCVLPEMCS